MGKKLVRPPSLHPGGTMCNSFPHPLPLTQRERGEMT